MMRCLMPGEVGWIGHTTRNTIAETLGTPNDFGFPLTRTEIRLTVRLSINIKSQRASVTTTEIIQFFGITREVLVCAQATRIIYSY